ncbi:MAG: DUF1674 domain-containing protein [Sneathiellaceae bacterium]
MSEQDRGRPAATPTAAEPEQDAGKPGGVKKVRPAHVLEQPPGEVGGPAGPEPTRYGDWSFKGIASDF